ncbi:hypothetical protein N7539_008312 [Penicillium diatomitis]|uniref:Uncharacterized protein n=1 Tax=Penicillium diatomitis TaxID=2819901 RepID=A0A9W9WTW3_9EURO|nr:uncharacterized protein N7539_008312 [Penicillium diatomitis]KAJ5475246.1 hypothetical protein N7539_008312 [Penicillium diatomitis]
MSGDASSKRRTLSETSGNSPKRPRLEKETSSSPTKTPTLRPAKIVYAGSTPVGPDPLRDCQAKIAEDIQSLEWNQTRHTAANSQGFDMLDELRQIRHDVSQLQSGLRRTEAELAQTQSKLGQTQSELQVVRQRARINDALHQTSKDVRRRAILSFHRDSHPTHRQDEELCREIRGLNKGSVHGGNVLADAHAIKEYYTSTDMAHREVAYDAFKTLYGTTPDNILQADVPSTAASVRTLNSIATQLYKLPKRHLTEEASQKRQSLVELLNRRQYEKAELFCEENNEFFALPEKGQESKLLVHEQNHPTRQDESTLPSNRRPNRSHGRKRGRRRA